MITAHDDAIPWHEVPEMAAISDAPLGETIRAFRESEEWTLKEVATRLGISHQMLSAYERGERLPNIETTLRIADALGMPPIIALKDLIRDQLRRAGLNYQVKLEQAS